MSALSSRRILAASLLAMIVLVPALSSAGEEFGSGLLKVVNKEMRDVQVPLAHTSVRADISGFVARVTVTQSFINPFEIPIEAVYVFPLPHRAAVDEMSMKIGRRVVKGVIKRRDEARKIYEAAKKAGKTAALLDQERPNIFTQYVANILPGDDIEIRISYVEILKYEEGEYEFVFPMVVGPRYIPGERIVGKIGGGWAPDTNRVPDASKITPPVLKPHQRSGHDIDITVNLEAGIPFYHLRSPSHMLKVKTKGKTRAKIRLDEADTIPNKDLILRYKVLGKAENFGIVTYTKDEQGHFLLILAPKASYAKKDIRPREIFFVIDSSGSQQGDPLVKSKQAVKRALKGLRPGDTFQVYNFNDIVTSMAPQTVPATQKNIGEAMRFVDQIRARGGTRMLPVIQAALNLPPDESRHRIVFMTTDGFIGNEVEIIREIHESLGDARLFSLGVGSSVNRYLLDRMAEEGRGFAQFVRQDEDTKKVVETFHRRIDAPVLTDIEIDWGGLKVTDLVPERVPDLYAGQPLVIHGRFLEPGKGTVRLLGRTGKGQGAISARIEFPKKDGGYDALGTVWARAKIEKIMARIESKGASEELEDQVTGLGLEYRLMTRYTSFVAVEEKVRNVDGKLKTVQVPVEMPEGVSYEGVFGKDEPDRPVMSLQTHKGAGRASHSYHPLLNMGASAKSASPKRMKMMVSHSRVAGAAQADADEVTGGASRRVPRVDPVAFLGISDERPYRQVLASSIVKNLSGKLDGIQPWPGGKVMMVSLSLAGDGTVRKVQILKDDTDNAALRRIIEKALAALRFPASGKDATLTFFLRF